MRFQIKESKAFDSAIAEAELLRSDFSFTKKGGWLSIKYPSKETVFHYHRKKEVSLLEDGTWSKAYFFFIKLNTKMKTCADLEEVIVEFRKWLDSN